MKKTTLPSYMAQALKRNLHRIYAGENAEQVIAEVVNVHPLMVRDVWSIEIMEDRVSICSFSAGNRGFWRSYSSVDEACAALSIIAHGGVPPMWVSEKSEKNDNTIISSFDTPVFTDWLSDSAQALFFSDVTYSIEEIERMTSLRGLPRCMRRIFVRSFAWLSLGLRHRLGCR